MIPEENGLRQIFHELVSNCYTAYAAVDDPEVASYVADLMTEFTAAEKLYRIRDTEGRPVHDVNDMLAASDPVHGTAASFDEERQLRKHIGDFALFSTGMYPEAMHLWRHSREASFVEMVRAGKESYYIVSQFDLFEYAGEAPLFRKLTDEFEQCIYGLTKVREELDRMKGPRLLM